MKIRLAPAAVAMLFAGVCFGQTRPEFGASVGVAYVDVFVSDRENPVRGLRGEDFELRDDGVPKRVEVVESDALPVQVLLVFDRSDSLTGERRDALRRAGELLLAALRPLDEVGVIGFSDEVTWVARPTVDRKAIHEAIASLEPVGATAVYDALLSALAVADPRGRTLVILFTDEVDNSSLLDATNLKAAAERSSAIIHLVTVRAPRRVTTDGVTPNPEPYPLETIAELTGGRAWVARSTATLNEAFTRIAASFATRYVLRYELSAEPKPGWHRLDIKLRSGKARVQARRGYWVGPSPRRSAW